MKLYIWKLTVLPLFTAITPYILGQPNLLTNLKSFVFQSNEIFFFIKNLLSASHRNKTSSISEKDLAQYLFQNYSSDCRPRKDAAQEVNVAIGFSIYAVNEIVCTFTSFHFYCFVSPNLI